MRKYVVGVATLLWGLNGLVAAPVDASPDQPASSTTSTSVGYELSDDFLTLYPGFDNDQYQYLLPDKQLLPATGPEMRAGIGALTVVLLGTAMLLLMRGPRRRRRRPSPPTPR